MTTPEIEELKNLVEQKYGKLLSTTCIFEEFSLALEKETEIKISASTLKRLYGYVSDSHKPRIQTLDALSKYIGYINYADFLKYLKTSIRYNSSFFQACQLSSSELDEGDEVVIGWSPNRTIYLRYLGNSTYEVTDAENSKLLPGDRFVTGSFIMHQPLYLPYIIRNDEQTSAFVAGRNGGLTIIRAQHKRVAISTIDEKEILNKKSI